jgi:eukaryotic-like serine/threonine-protein kinase
VRWYLGLQRIFYFRLYLQHIRDTRLDRTVAIKVSKEQFSERFEREASAIAALNTPTSASSTTSGRTTWSWSVEGEPLRGPLPLEGALGIAGQIADACAKLRVTSG